ncbi:unnamed protein product [Schistosoma turkestanicum]|nr:unnamed protein product [Schistosoma turkestanicum]
MRSGLLFFIVCVSSFVALARKEGNEPDKVEPVTFNVKGCLLLSTIMKIHISKSDSEDSESVFITYINSTNAKSINSSGICMNSTSEEYNLLNLIWKPTGSMGNWNLSFNFSHTYPGYYGLTKVYLLYWLNGSDRSNAAVAINDKTLFSCAIGSSFTCIKEQTFELKDKLSKLTNIRLTFSNFQVEAFRNSSNNDDNKNRFIGPTYSCSADYVQTNVVPIVVGVLLFMVIITSVLFKFIIINRCRQSNYQQI